MEIDIPFNSTLDILVENMGRINYGAEIVRNNKGIISPVKINDIEITGDWAMYKLPMSETPVLSDLKNVKVYDNTPANAAKLKGCPVVYQGTFNLTETGDTFIDMEQWGKGIIYINGINIGRYWKVGPQQTLYIPGVWLKKGSNQIVIFEQLNDERNRAMSEALGEDVYHYHLHVVYIPVVEKQILWSKRCKDESLRGTVKETITQVSRSKKWESKPVLDENGNPMLNAKGKKILKSSYSVLQDDFFNFMRNAGYTDVERGECGSTEEHLTVTQFKVQAEQQRLEAVTGQVAQAEQSLADAKAATEKQKKKLEALKKETQAAKSVAMTAHEIESMGKKNPITGNVTMTADECRTLKDYAVSSFAEKSEKLKYKQKFEQADKNAKIWKDRFEKLNKDYEELKQKAQPFLDAIEIASEKVWAFINAILARGKELYEHKHPARNRGQDMEI
jgi:hypothetical protein